MLEVILKRFEQPDEVRQFEKGKFELVHFGGMTIGRATYLPGWKWSEHVGKSIEEKSCDVEHVGIVLSGRAVAAMDSGEVIEMKAGDVFYIPPGHDSWVVGDEPYVSLHLKGANQYALHKQIEGGGKKMMSTRDISTPDFRERAKANDVPIARLIGFEAKEIGEGKATVTLTGGPQHANPMGTLHGGILCDIADAAMGIAFASSLSPGESFTTVELKINFFRPVWEARLRAEGHVVRRGRNLGYIECEITDEEGKMVAKAASTCLVLRGEDARGR